MLLIMFTGFTFFGGIEIFFGFSAGELHPISSRPKVQASAAAAEKTALEFSLRPWRVVVENNAPKSPNISHQSQRIKSL